MQIANGLWSKISAIVVAVALRSSLFRIRSMGEWYALGRYSFVRGKAWPQSFKTMESYMATAMAKSATSASSSIGNGESNAIIPAAEMDQIIKLDATARAANRQLVEASKAGNEMAKGLIMARAIEELKKLMTPAVMSDIMRLMNSPLGFKTDRVPGQKDRDGNDMKPYPDAAVRDVMIQAMIKGLRPTGNELNIIAGQLDVTKEGLERLIKEFPGLKNLKVQIGVPMLIGDGALVPAKASWTLDGVADTLDCEKDYRIPVRVNKAMGTDAIQGKAVSKLLRKIYQRVTGSELESEADAGEPDESTTVQAESVAEVSSQASGA
jgi:hypothetical protein